MRLLIHGAIIALIIPMCIARVSLPAFTGDESNTAGARSSEMQWTALSKPYITKLNNTYVLCSLFYFEGVELHPAYSSKGIAKNTGYYVPLMLPYAMAIGNAPHSSKLNPVVSSGMSYSWFGQIAKVSSADLRVDAEGANYYVLVDGAGFNVSYARHDYKLTGYSAGVSKTANQSANVFAYEWVSEPLLVKLPNTGGVALGSVMYFDDNKYRKVNFSQPYAAYTFQYGDRVNGQIGVNWVRGSIEHAPGTFINLGVSVNDELSLFADYNSKNFQKLVFNRVVLPLTGIDCSSCRNDALSVGLTMKIGDAGVASIGFFDMYDLKAPFGSLSLNKAF